MFKFNFDTEGGKPQSSGSVKNETCSEEKQAPVSGTSLEMEIIDPKKECKINIGDSAAGARDSVLPINSLKIVMTAPELQGAETRHSEESAVKAAANTDVLPGVYEGGFKVWECAIDLVKYLQSEAATTSQLSKIYHPQNETGTRILDLGCGHGLPGIASLLLGNKSVYLCFQDLNREVIIRNTIPNVCKSTSVQVLNSQCGFISGDWENICKNGIREPVFGVFDLVLTAETIYSPSSYEKLFMLLESCTHAQSIILVAAKRYYFGVGGGTSSFSTYIEGKKIFSTRVVASFSDGESNIRDILELRKT